FHSECLKNAPRRLARFRVTLCPNRYPRLVPRLHRMNNEEEASAPTRSRSREWQEHRWREQPRNVKHLDSWPGMMRGKRSVRKKISMNAPRGDCAFHPIKFRFRCGPGMENRFYRAFDTEHLD